MNDSESVTLTTTDQLLYNFMLAQELRLDEGLEIGNTAEQSSVHLEENGYIVLTVRQALVFILSSPDSTEAVQLMACLMRWLFIAKI